MPIPKQQVHLEGKIQMHLAGGRTKVAIKLGGVRLIEVDTESIPEHLRPLGTKVLVVYKPDDRARRVGEDEFVGWGPPTIADFPEHPDLGFRPVE
jgi:hypothetical protein